MKILILGALEKEVSILKELINSTDNGSFSYVKTYKNDIYVATIGVGIMNAFSSTYSLIETIHPDIVINIGTAGAHSLEINDGDIVVCDEAIYHGGYIMNSSPIYSWNTITDTDLFIKGDNELSNLIEKANLQVTIHHGKTLSGDFFTKDINMINSLQAKYHHMCEDMETIAIYKVCKDKKTPCISYRIISNSELRGSSYNDNVLKVNKKLQEVIFELLQYLEQH